MKMPKKYKLPTLKQILSRELNWLMFRIQGSHLHTYKRIFPYPVNELLKKRLEIDKEILAAIEDKEYRDIYYKANGAIENESRK